ncbi:hypothetical protein L6164_012942 [Bauhinia variegata]|uniref:Uncharacterized protein n=1 Tax=Bauhinia variegata TaxID=167791 RepID=A0ACB9PBM4_BAUVA|nr:hypothetical protein L6164_012942 [Bauhinia variegata]
MAERTQPLVQKLIDLIPKVTDESISEALLAVKDAFQGSEPYLDRADWNREVDALVAATISNIKELLDEIEDIVDHYSHHLCDLSDEGESEIRGLIYNFLGIDRNLLNELPAEFSDLFKCLSNEACEQLERQLRLIRFESNSSEDPEILFVDRNEGWVEPAFNPPNLL